MDKNKEVIFFPLSSLFWDTLCVYVCACFSMCVCVCLSVLPVCPPLVCVCMCVVMYMWYMCVQVCVPVCTCRGQRMLGVLLYHFLSYSFESASFIGSRAQQAASKPQFNALSPGVTGAYTATCNFLRRGWDLNLDPCICEVSILHTDPSSSPFSQDLSAQVLGREHEKELRVFSSLLSPMSVYFEETAVPATMATLSHTASVSGNQPQLAS